MLLFWFVNSVQIYSYEYKTINQEHLPVLSLLMWQPTSNIAPSEPCSLVFMLLCKIPFHPHVSYCTRVDLCDQ